MFLNFSPSCALDTWSSANANLRPYGARRGDINRCSVGCAVFILFQSSCVCLCDDHGRISHFVVSFPFRVLFSISAQRATHVKEPLIPPDISPEFPLFFFLRPEVTSAGFQPLIS